MHRNFRSMIARLIVLVAVVLTASGALAQGVTGSAVTGMVKDPSGGPAAGAAVTLKNTSNGLSFTAVSGPDGKFSFDNIPSGGPYELACTPEGYTPVKKEGIQL